MDFNQRVGELLRKSRLAQNMTQEELHERTGIKSYYISRIENGKLDIRLRTLSKLANGLGIRMSDLFLQLETKEQITNQ